MFTCLFQDHACEVGPWRRLTSSLKFRVCTLRREFTLEGTPNLGCRLFEQAVRWNFLPLLSHSTQGLNAATNLLVLLAAFRLKTVAGFSVSGLLATGSPTGSAALSNFHFWLRSCSDSGSSGVRVARGQSSALDVRSDTVCLTSVLKTVPKILP